MTTRTGRKSKLTAELVTELERIVGSGVPASVAAETAGIGRSTLFGWLAEAERGRGGLHAELLDAITRAKSKAEAVAVSRLFRAASDDWRAASWWLAHHPRTRDRWSDAAAVRRAEAAVLAGVVDVIEAEISDAAERHRLLTALAAAGLTSTAREATTDGE